MAEVNFSYFKNEDSFSLPIKNEIIEGNNPTRL